MLLLWESVHFRQRLSCQSIGEQGICRGFVFTYSTFGDVVLAVVQGNSTNRYALLHLSSLCLTQWLVQTYNSQNTIHRIVKKCAFHDFGFLKIESVFLSFQMHSRSDKHYPLNSTFIQWVFKFFFLKHFLITTFRLRNVHIQKSDIIYQC